MGSHDWLPTISANADVLIQGDFSQEISASCLCELLSATGSENVHTCAIWQIKIGHVLDDAKDRHFQRFEHVQAAACIFQRDKLRQGHDHCAAEGQSLCERERGITSSWWQVHDQVVKFAPFNITQKLTDGRVEHWTAPDKRLPWLDEQPHRDHFDAVSNGRDETLSLWWREFFNTQHCGGVGTVNVRVHEADARAALCKRHSD